MSRIAVLVLSLVVSLAGLAAPVVIDTPTAKIIVARPADAWSPDVGASEDNLEAIKKRRLAYVYETPDGRIFHGNPAVFSGISNYPITKGVEAEFVKIGATLARGGESRNSLFIHSQVSMEGRSVAGMFEWQRRLYEKVVIAAGDPDKAAQSVTMKKWLGGALAVAAIAVGGQQFGATGANAVLSSGMADDVYRATYEYNTAVVPVVLPEIDLTEFPVVDVRRVDVGVGKRMGQIIVAYKTEKTDEAELDAMVKAIVAVSSMDEDPEDVTKARAEDFMRRKAIWSACVKSGQCKAAGS